MNLKTLALAAAALVISACPAWAAPIVFNYVGAQGTLSFTLNDPSDYAVSTPGVGVQYTVTGLENGVASDFGGGIIFGSTTELGGFQTFDGNFNLTGPQIYGGSEAAPTFSPTTTPLALSADGGATIDGAAAITPAAAAPEPSTWALMIAGVGLAGAALRRRNVLRAA